MTCTICKGAIDTRHNATTCPMKPNLAYMNNLQPIHVNPGQRLGTVPVYPYSSPNEMSQPFSYTGPALCSYCNQGFYRAQGMRNCPKCNRKFHGAISQSWGNQSNVFIIYHWNFFLFRGSFWQAWHASKLKNKQIFSVNLNSCRIVAVFIKQFSKLVDDFLARVLFWFLKSHEKPRKVSACLIELLGKCKFHNEILHVAKVLSNPKRLFSDCFFDAGHLKILNSE